MWSENISNHAVDLVYEAGCCSSLPLVFFKLGLECSVVNPADVRQEIKSDIKKQMT
jgi:hypothetical protein